MNSLPTKLALLLLAVTLPLQAAGGFVAREWGVVETLQTGWRAGVLSLPILTLSASANPDSVTIPLNFPGNAREPVIYIDSADKKPFSLSVSFTSGRVTSTFPRAVTNLASLTWADVRFEGPSQQPALADCDKPIVELLGDKGADKLFVDGRASRYLFYEGEILRARVIGLVKNAGGGLLEIKNHSIHDLQNLLLVIPNGKGWQVARYAVVAKRQSVKLELKSYQDRKKAPFPDLRKQGFKPAEAEAFERIWKPLLYEKEQKSPSGWAFYQLAPEACDEVSVLKFTPPPKKLTRVLFVKESFAGPDL